MSPRLALAALLTSVALTSGCGGAASHIPASASLAPADAIAFATFTTDAESSQWQHAEALVERVPGVRDSIMSGIEEELAEDDLDWEADVAPALGDEVVLVVTAQMKPVVLLQPESEEKLDALMAKSDEPTVRGEVDGWVAVAETNAHLTAYRTALARGTIEADDGFVAGLAALPEESLGRAWVDLSAVTDELSSLFEETTREQIQLGVEWLSAAISAEEQGMLVAMGVQSPGAGDSHYEPELFDRVPADAVVAFSFGGTQGTLDQVQGQLDVDGLSESFEDLTGVSSDGVLDALTGEGVLYVRPGGPVPDVTLALAPPDPDKTWTTVDRLARRLAAELQVDVTETMENGVAVSTLLLGDVTVRYARPDAGTIVVTNDADGLTMLAGDGPKLVDSEGFQRAAEDVGLGERTKGFLYLDVDGLLPMLEDLYAASVPADVRERVAAVDSIMLQTSGDGDTGTVSGFVRVP
jgi:hypothetical protein